MPKVKVSLMTILSHIALTMLVGVERARVHIDIGVELLDRYTITTALQELPKRSRHNTLPKRRDHTTCHKYIPRITLHHLTRDLLSLYYFW